MDAIRYHEATKHHYHRYARSTGRMDWENQPIPFRFYEGAAPVRLPFLETDPRAAGNTIKITIVTQKPSVDYVRTLGNYVPLMTS